MSKALICPCEDVTVEDDFARRIGDDFRLEVPARFVARDAPDRARLTADR